MNPGPGKVALVLNAHTGVGAVLVRRLAGLGVDVWGQVPISDSSDSPTTPEELAHEAGASHTLASPPLLALASLPTHSFDFVLDTIGSLRIYDASLWVLKSGGQFTTLVGDRGPWDSDEGVVPYEKASLRSSMRSIKSSFLHSGSSGKGAGGEGRRKAKNVSYEWVLPNAELSTDGEDVRDTLTSVAQWASGAEGMGGGVRVERFEETGEAFVGSKGVFRDGGVVVSRIIG